MDNTVSTEQKGEIFQETVAAALWAAVEPGILPERQTVGIFKRAWHFVGGLARAALNSNNEEATRNGVACLPPK